MSAAITIAPATAAADESVCGGTPTPAPVFMQHGQELQGRLHSIISSTEGELLASLDNYIVRLPVSLADELSRHNGRHVSLLRISSTYTVRRLN